MHPQTAAKWVRSICLVLALFGLLLPGRPVRATAPPVFERYYVKPGGSGDCSAWGTACGLQTALSQVPTGKEVWVMKGTYTPGSARTDTITVKSGVSVYGGFAGTETARDERNPAANPTLLSGDIGTAGVSGDNSYTVVTLSGSSSASALLDGVTVSGGNANLANGVGGGVVNSSNSTATLQNVIIANNSAATSGGGIFDRDLTHLTLATVTLSGNSAGSGGGIGASGYAGLNLTNVTLEGNTAAGSGGGISIGRQSNATLTNVTLVHNTAASAGAIVVGTFGGVSLTDSIVWGNTAADGTPFYFDPQSGGAIQDSLLQGGCPSGKSCTNLVTGDPLLGSLGSFGGPVLTTPLLPGSAAIDAGNSATCAAVDARGVARPQGAACDLGAFESRGFSLARTDGDGQSTIIDTIFSIPLSVAVTSSFGEPVDGGLVTFTGPSAGAGIALTPANVTVSGGAAAFNPAANGSAGSYTVNARAAGAAQGNTFGLTNVLLVPWVTLSASPNPVLAGHPLMVTVTVQRTRSYITAPTGTVTLYRLGEFSPAAACAGASLGVKTLVDSQADFAISGLPGGSIPLVVVYSGDDLYQPATSAPYTLVITTIHTYLPVIRR